MKLHDLHPAPGSRRERIRVGRGIAAGKGKTAGRGTKGQRSRTGSSIPAWFEGGQTPVHIRVPKLRGFKNRFRVEYGVVNIGRIEAALETGRLEPGPKGAPATVNAELLFAAGLLGRPNLPLKILGGGELKHRILAVADAFSREARRKIEAGGGSVMVLELPTVPAAPEKARRADKPATTQPVTPEATETLASSAEPAEAPPEPTVEPSVETSPPAAPEAPKPAGAAKAKPKAKPTRAAKAKPAAPGAPAPSAEEPKPARAKKAEAEPAERPAASKRPRAAKPAEAESEPAKPAAPRRRSPKTSPERPA